MCDITLSNNSYDHLKCGFYFLTDSNSYLGRPLHSVGKRTPRFPVSHLHKKDENYVSAKKKRRKLEINADDNDDEHVAALTLTETLQRGDSAQVPQTPHRRTEHMKSSPVQSWDKMVFYCRPVFHCYCYFGYAILQLSFYSIGFFSQNHLQRIFVMLPYMNTGLKVAQDVGGLILPM